VRCFFAAVCFWLAPTTFALAQNCVVTGSTVYGTVEQHCIINLVTPPAELRFLSVKAISNNLTALRVEVASSYAPGTLLIAVKGASVTQVSPNPLTQGTVSFGHWEAGDIHFIRIQNPFGQYEITVTKTDSAEVPFVEFAFNR
jgi:hypothetical protein